MNPSESEKKILEIKPDTDTSNWLTHNILREEYIIYLCIAIPILLFLCYKLLKKKKPLHRSIHDDHLTTPKRVNKNSMEQSPSPKELATMRQLKESRRKDSNPRESWDKRDSVDRTQSSIHTDNRSDSLDSNSILGESYVIEKNKQLEGDLNATGGS